MLTQEQLQDKINGGLTFLDGATGSNLQAMGMPRGCCTEEWILSHPDALLCLQLAYAAAGCQIIYAPTFQAQPIALERANLQSKTEIINSKLVALSRSAAPNCLVAGDLTTLAAFCNSNDPKNFDQLVENYRRQIRGLVDGGADLLIAETLMYQQEAEAILTAAEMEGAGATMYSFIMNPDGSFLSGQDSIPFLQSLAEAGAAAVGFNCVAADMMTPHLVRKLCQNIHIPILCKPNAGNPIITSDGIVQYDMTSDNFAQILLSCKENGAKLLGGCCGTTPAHIEAAIKAIRSL